ncbi:TPA: hypothetical protein ENX78_00105 [Candidatus Poribacteria bacterium]|nr:hypothetical protein [Candidatus Poribacteria bacterium]
MQTCDFSRSFITFTTKNRTNNARIQVESRCEITDQDTGKSETYYLVASCKGEDTYGKGRLFFVPNYDFCMIYSSKDFIIIRTYHNAELNNITVGDNKGHFLDVHFHIKMTEADIVDDNNEIVKATLSNYPINGRTEICDNHAKIHATIEFPIKTMNVNDQTLMYQVDTGPILLPNFESKKDRMVECFDLAYIAYNRSDEAHFVVLEPTPIKEVSSDKVSHYSKVLSAKAKNSIIVIK